MSRTSVNFKGVDYPSHQKLAEAFGIGYTTLKARLAAGKTISEAVSSPIAQPGEMNTKQVTVGSTIYPSHKDLCVSKNISYSTYNSHRRRGKSAQEAIELTLKAQETITIFGVEYGSPKAVADALGLKYGTLTARLRKGQPIQTAVAQMVAKL